MELPVSHHQHVEGVVDALLAAPAVAVVPLPDPLSVEPLQFGGEDYVEVVLGVAAEGGEARIERDVLEAVQAREQADLGELAHSGEEAEAHVLVTALDDCVKAAQVVAVGSGDVGIVEHVQDRLVVLVD